MLPAVELQDKGLAAVYLTSFCGTSILVMVRAARTDAPRAHSEKGVRLAQKMRVGTCMPVGMQLQTPEVGPTSGPTWRLSHWRRVLQRALCMPLGALAEDGVHPPPYGAACAFLADQYKRRGS